MTENASSVPVTAEDLQVGDVIKWPDGRYCAVDSLPDSHRYPQEYAVPKFSVWVTELNQDMTPSAQRSKEIYSQDAVFDVLTPRPLLG
jgi:hypothetical protein